MAETIEKIETVELTETPAEIKPYSFRKLSSDDIFLMLRIFGKIGVKELKKCFEGDSLESVIASFKNSDKSDKALVAIGVSIGFDGVDIILNNLPKCDKEIYQLLTQVANGSVTEEQIRADALLFMEMLVDFVKKEEFPAFIKVVSKLFK
jgi:hypothetical protein